MRAWQVVRNRIAALREQRQQWKADQEPTIEQADTGPGPEPIDAAEDAAARISTDDQPLGKPGKPLDHRSPFFIGLTGALGVGVAYGLFQILISARDILTLIGLAVFLAIGLN